MLWKVQATIEDWLTTTNVCLDGGVDGLALGAATHVGLGRVDAVEAAVATHERARGAGLARLGWSR